MIDPEYYEKAAIPLSRMINELEAWVLVDAARRISKNNSIPATADYRLSRLEEIRGFEVDYKAKLAELTDLSRAEIARLYWEVAELSLAHDEGLYQSLNKPFIPAKENAFAQQVVPALIRHTNAEMSNLTRTTALKFLSPYKKFVPLPDAFRQHLDFAEFKVASGVQDYTGAIREAIGMLSEGGMRVIRYENEGKRPVNRRAETVAKMTVLTGMAQLAGQVAAHNVLELEAQHVQVSYHMGARTGNGGGLGDITNHQFWSGKIYSLSDKFFEMANNPLQSAPNDDKIKSSENPYREFASKETLNAHIDKHLKEYQNFSESDYINRATELLNSPISYNVAGFTSKSGKTYRYDIGENDFAVGNKNGTIATLFKPADKRKYYERQVRKYGN